MRSKEQPWNEGIGPGRRHEGPVLDPWNVTQGRAYGVEYIKPLALETLMYVPYLSSARYWSASTKYYIWNLLSFLPNSHL